MNPSCTRTLLLLFMTAVAHAYGDVTNLTQGGAAYATIQSAVTGANPGDTLRVNPGTYYVTNVILDKASLMLQGSSTNDTLVVGPDQASGKAFTIAATNITMRDLRLQVPRPDNSELISISRGSGSYAKILGNVLEGQYVMGIGAVSVGISVAYGGGTGGGVTNLCIQNNIFRSLRQPGRMDGTRINSGTGLPLTGYDECSGTIASNFTYHTRGWTLWGGTTVSWKDNVFGTGQTNRWGTDLGPGEQVNVGDLSILTGTSHAPYHYYTNIVAISRSNSLCVVEDQRLTPRLLSVCYVDPASTAGSGVRYEPYATLTQAVNRIAWDGTIRALPGTYSSTITLAKNATFELVASTPTTSFDIVAEPPRHYRFGGWSGTLAGCTVAGRRITVVMDGTLTISASFEPLGPLVELR